MTVDWDVIDRALDRLSEAMEVRRTQSHAFAQLHEERAYLGLVRRLLRHQRRPDLVGAPSRSCVPKEGGPEL